MAPAASRVRFNWIRADPRAGFSALVIGGTSFCELSAAVKLMVVGSGVPGLGDEGPSSHDTAKNRAHDKHDGSFHRNLPLKEARTSA